MTALYRRLVPNFNPRFVFLLDADEFITAPSREALYQELRELRPGTLAGYFWQTYIPSPTVPKPVGVIHCAISLIGRLSNAITYRR